MLFFTKNTLAFLLAFPLIALVIAAWLGAILFVDNYYPNLGISAEELLNFVLVCFIAIAFLPVMQIRLYRNQNAVIRKQEEKDEAPLAAPPAKVHHLAFALVGKFFFQAFAACSLILVFGPLSLQAMLFGWMADTGFFTKSIRSFEILILTAIFIVACLAAIISGLLRYFGGKWQRTFLTRLSGELSRTWFRCFARSYATCVGLCLASSFFILRFL